jgi:hypothetical protein
MQVDGKQEDKKETYHSTLVLERFFICMFQEDFGVIEKTTTKTQKYKKLKRNCNRLWIVGEEHQEISTYHGEKKKHI